MDDNTAAVIALVALLAAFVGCVWLFLYYISKDD